MATTFKPNDNLPLVGRLEGATYVPARPNPNDTSKSFAPDLRLSGRWTEFTVAGPVEKGAGDVYLRAEYEAQLLALGVIAVVGTDPTGIPKYRVAHPGPIQILRTADGTRKVFAVSWAGAPGTFPPGPPAPVAIAAPSAPAAYAPPPQQPSYPPAPAPVPHVGPLPYTEAGVVMPPPRNGNGQAPQPPAVGRAWEREPAPALTEAEVEERRAAARKKDFAEWLGQGDALTTAYLLARHAADTAGVPYDAASLQAGAATILIRAEKAHIPHWRGLGKAMADYLGKQRPAAVAPVAPAKTAADVEAQLAARGRAPVGAMAGAGKRSDGFDRIDSDEPEGGDDDLPF